MGELWLNGRSYSGGGGADVEITPTLATGTKIAEYEIDGVSGELYAPSGGGTASSVSYDNTDSGLTANNVQDAIDEVVDDLVGYSQNIDTTENNIFSVTSDAFQLLYRPQSLGSITSSTNIFAFGNVLYKGLYNLIVYTDAPITIYLFGLYNANETALTLLKSYDLTPINGKASLLLNITTSCMLGLKGVIKYDRSGSNLYNFYNVTLNNNVYTKTANPAGTLQFNLELHLVELHTDDYIDLKNYALPANVAQLCSRVGELYTRTTEAGRLFGFGRELFKGIYKIKIYTTSIVNVFIFNVTQNSNIVTIENAFTLYPINGMAERIIEVKNNSLLGFSGLINFSTASTTPDRYDLYDISVTNGVYTKSLSSNKVRFDIDLFNYTNSQNENASQNGIPYIATSQDEIKIKLLGDSITQGSGSTGYVEFTLNGNVYRGNAPDYPDAGADYQVGDYLGTASGVYWYEALDGSGWGQLLKEYFESKFNCTVKNYGMGGATTVDILNNLSNIVDSDDDIVTLMVGTNDTRSITLETYTANLESIISSLIAFDKKVILISSLPLGVSVDAVRNFHMEDVNNVCASLAYKYNIQFISVFNILQMYCETKNITIDSLLKGDGIHPNDNGYVVMYKIITNELGIGYKRNGASW